MATVASGKNERSRLNFRSFTKRNCDWWPFDVIWWRTQLCFSPASKTHTHTHTYCVFEWCAFIFHFSSANALITRSIRSVTLLLSLGVSVHLRTNCRDLESFVCALFPLSVCFYEVSSNYQPVKCETWQRKTRTMNNKRVCVCVGERESFMKHCLSIHTVTGKSYREQRNQIYR